MEYGVLSPKEGLTAARLASGRALNHAPDLAESLTSAALVRQMALDWNAAETEFKAAIAAHPGYGMARQRFALFLSWMGRWDESRRQMKTALALGRHSPVIAASAAWIEYYQGSFQEAAKAARTALSQHPGFTSAEIPRLTGHGRLRAQSPARRLRGKEGKIWSRVRRAAAASVRRMESER